MPDSNGVASALYTASSLTIDDPDIIDISSEQ